KARPRRGSSVSEEVAAVEDEERRGDREADERLGSVAARQEGEPDYGRDEYRRDHEQPAAPGEHEVAAERTWRSDAEEAVRLVGLERVGDVGVGEVPRRTERGGVIGEEQQYARQRAGGEPEQRTHASACDI